jgi:hypothetical protein
MPFFRSGVGEEAVDIYYNVYDDKHHRKTEQNGEQSSSVSSRRQACLHVCRSWLDTDDMQHSHGTRITQRMPHCRWQNGSSIRDSEEQCTQPRRDDAQQKHPERPRVVLIMGSWACLLPIHLHSARMMQSSLNTLPTLALRRYL